MDAEQDMFFSLRAKAASNPRGMSYDDIIAVIPLLERFMCDLDTNLAKLTTAFYRDHILSVQQYIQVQNRSGSGLRVYMQNIARLVSLEKFISALRDIGCSQLADLLLLERFGSPTLCLTSSEAPNATMLNRFYTSLMALIQSSRLPNKFAALSNYCNILRNKAGDAKELTTRRQCAYDLYSVAICILLNHCRTRSDRAHILRKHNDFVPCGLDKQCSEIAYCVGMCTAARKNGNSENAESFLSKASYLNTVYNNSFFKLLIWHSQFLLRRKLHYDASKDDAGTRENLTEAVSACDEGLTCAVPEPDVVREPWTATFRLFTAMLLLRIGLLGHPTANDLRKAEDFVVAATRCSSGWTPRRIMMLKVCMAGIHQNTDRNLAISECKEAMELAKEGAYTFDEKRKLKEYLLKLQQ